MRVIVIGGGIGGLCLAHGLHKAGIEVQVFERQIEKSENLAGYGLHIDRNGRQALRSCLPLSNWARLQALFTTAGTQLFFRDTQLRLLAEVDNAVLSGKPTSEVERSGVGRLDLRDALLDGLNSPASPIIHWGREFLQYEQFDDGRISVHFADGTSEVGDVLVGADGPDSLVRQQYLAKLGRSDLGVMAIAGRYVLEDKNVHEFPSDLTNGALNNIVPSGKGWMFTSAWRSRPAEKTTVSEAQHYVVWAYVLPTNQAVQLNGLIRAYDLQQFVLQGIKDWSTSLQVLVEGADLSTIKRISLRSMPTLTPWEPSNVTLLGDAIHNMTPMAGMGANTALRDAEVLTRCLTDVAAKRLSLVDGIRIYEEEMRSYANDAIKLSTGNAKNASNGGSIQRLLFRGFLFAAQTFPRVMRATFGSSMTK